jgi:hypothetical protein
MMDAPRFNGIRPIRPICPIIPSLPLLRTHLPSAISNFRRTERQAPPWLVGDMNFQFQICYFQFPRDGARVCDPQHPASPSTCEMALRSAGKVRPTFGLPLCPSLAGAGDFSHLGNGERSLPIG